MDIFLTLASLLGGSIVSNTRESGTPSNDGEGSGTYTGAYDTECKVPCNLNLLILKSFSAFELNGYVFFCRGEILGFTMLSSILFVSNLLHFIFYPVFFYILPSFI
jgi:hypothetical protein